MMKNITIDKLNEKLSTKNDDLKRAEEKIAKLQSKIDAEKARMEKLNNEIKSIEGEIIIQMVRSSDISLRELPSILAVHQQIDTICPSEVISDKTESSKPVEIDSDTQDKDDNCSQSSRKFFSSR